MRLKMGALLTNLDKDLAVVSVGSRENSGPDRGAHAISITTGPTLFGDDLDISADSSRRTCRYLEVVTGPTIKYTTRDLI
jgi:hypothetical protein